MKKCPVCAESIQNEAIMCRYCKASLIEAPNWQKRFFNFEIKNGDQQNQPQKNSFQSCMGCLGFVAVGFIILLMIT